MSRALSTNRGSLESARASDRCGCSPNAFRIRRAVVRESPAFRAIERIDRCAASGGDVSSVRSTTFVRPRVLRAPRTPRTRRVRQSLDTILRETPPPLADGAVVRAGFRRHRLARQAIGAAQDDAAAVRHPPRHPAAAHPALKERPFFGARHHGRHGLAHTRLAAAACGSRRLEPLEIAAWVRIGVRRIEIAMDTNHPFMDEFRTARRRPSAAAARSGAQLTFPCNERRHRQAEPPIASRRALRRAPKTEATKQTRKLQRTPHTAPRTRNVREIRVRRFCRGS